MEDEAALGGVGGECGGEEEESNKDVNVASGD